MGLTMSTVHEQNATLTRPHRIIIATLKVNEFTNWFASAVNKIVYIFGGGTDALTFWKDARKRASTTLFIDYTSLSDGQTGIRLTKAIRDYEKTDPTQEEALIYLMADKPLVDELLLKKLGVNGTVLKNPNAASKVLGNVHSNESSASDDESNLPLPADLLQAIEKQNLVLRRFVGAAANMISDEAVAALLNGSLPRNKKAYAVFLASRIPSEEMREGFLGSVEL
jgi:predicted transcriptional regulator